MARLARALVLTLLAAHAPRVGAARDPRPAAPAELRIGFEQERARAGATAVVYVFARDEEGRPADAPIALASDLGEVGPLVRVREGLYRATLTAPKVLPGKRSILLSARSGAVQGQARVPVGSEVPAAMELRAPAAVVADGESRARLEVALFDAYGNAADDAPRARAVRGVLGPAEPIGPGRWAIEYRPHPIRAGAEDVVTVEAGPLRREHPIRLTARRAWLACAPWSGVTLDAGGEALAFGAGVSAWRRLGAGHVGLVLDAGWWRIEERTSIALPGGAAELDAGRAYLPVTLSLSWEQRVGRRVVASLSAGGGAALVTSTQRIAGQPDVTEGGWSAAGVAALGLGVRAWKGTPFLEARALWIGDPGLATLSGSAHPVLLLAGYRFDGR